jgi:hypothetical protein
MAKILKFNPKGEPEKNKPQKAEEKTEQREEKVIKATPSGSSLENAKPLTEEDFKNLFEPLREGLKKLYPSQVEDVLGFYGLGEKNGNKTFVVGAVIWKRYGVKQPYASTMVALFENNELKKVSFLEAKNNYWDWKTLIKVHKGEFHTEEIFNRAMALLKGQTEV